jgi:hypothetical protein
MIKADWILVGKHYLKSQRDGNHHLREIEIITVEIEEESRSKAEDKKVTT